MLLSCIVLQEVVRVCLVLVRISWDDYDWGIVFVIPDGVGQGVADGWIVIH
jgi:hypothetical protein